MRIAIKKSHSCRVLRTIVFIGISLLSLNFITACSGYGESSNNPYADLMDAYNYSSFDDDWFYESSSSSYRYSSSSSYGYTSSSSSNGTSNSSSSYNNLSSSSFIIDSTAVKKIADLDSCSNNQRVNVLEDSSTYYCFYGQWFKELKTAPKCTDKNENETFYKNAPFVCSDEKWREVSIIEAQLGFCTSQNQGKTKILNGYQHICDSLEWRKQTLTEVNGTCTSEKAGDSISYGDTSYVCRGGSWNRLSKIESDSGVCTKKRFGELLSIEQSYSSYKYLYYVCRDYEWKSTTAAEDVIGKCDSTIAADSVYKVSSSNYVCENGTWRSATSVELSYGICNANKQDTIKKSGSSKYICDKGTWRITNAEEYYGACNDSLADITYVYNSITYACFNNKWNELPKPPVSGLSYCTKKNNGSKTRTTSPKAYYICNNYVWEKVDTLTYALGYCVKDSLGIRKSNYECRNSSGTYKWVKLTLAEQLGAECTEANDGELIQGYVCDSTKWRLQTAREKNIGETCTHSKIGQKADYAGESYACQSKGWISFTEELNTMGACTDEGRIIKNDTMTKVCYLEKWVKLGNIIIDTSKTHSCGRDNVGTIGLYKKEGMIYYCAYSLDPWRAAGPISMEVGYVCTMKNTGKIVMTKDSIYYTCRLQLQYHSFWSPRELDEILTTCAVGTEKDVVGQKYTCTETNHWTPVYGSVKDKDGKSYKTFKVGKQLWMAENLNTETPHSSCYNSNSDNCSKFGRLYEWADISSVCPDGWHIPSVEDYWTYTKHPLAPSILADSLWQDNNETTYYSSSKIAGLEILPAGMKNASGSYEFMNRVGGMWLSDESSSGYGYVEAYGNSKNQSWTTETPTDQFTSIGDSKHPSAYRVSKSYAFPVRCVKDLK